MKVCERCNKEFSRKDIVALRGDGLEWFNPVYLCRPCYDHMMAVASKVFDKVLSTDNESPQ